MAEFSYDPTSNINKYFEKAASDIGSVFSTLVEAKRKDNQLAEKTYLNIEALKKDVSIYGQKKINESVNSLLKESKGKMFKDGKINSEYLGELRQKVSDIKDDKSYYNSAPELMKIYQETGIKNIDDMDSFSSFQREIISEMTSGTTKNIPDLQKKFDKILDNHTNYDLIGLKSFLSANPLEGAKFTKTDIDPKTGQESKSLVEYEAPKNWLLDTKNNTVAPPKTVAVTDPATGKIVEVPYLTKAAADIERLRPGFFDKYRAKANFGVNVTNEQITENIIRSVKTPKANVETKDVYQMQSEKAKAKIDTLEADNKPTEIDAKNRLVESQIRENNNQAAKALRDLNKGGTPPTSLRVTPRTIPLKDRSGKIVPGKTQTVYDMTLPKPFSMDFPGTKDYEGGGSEIGALKVISVTKGADGNFVLSGYKVDKSKMDASNPFSDIPTTSDKLMNVKLNKGQYDAFINRVQGFAKEDTQNVMGGLEGMKKNLVDLDSFR